MGVRDGHRASNSTVAAGVAEVLSAVGVLPVAGPGSAAGDRARARPGRGGGERPYRSVGPALRADGAAVPGAGAPAHRSGVGSGPDPCGGRDRDAPRAARQGQPRRCDQRGVGSAEQPRMRVAGLLDAGPAGRTVARRGQRRVSPPGRRPSGCHRPGPAGRAAGRGSGGAAQRVADVDPPGRPGDGEPAEAAHRLFGLVGRRRGQREVAGRPAAGEDQSLRRGSRGPRRR